MNRIKQILYFFVKISKEMHFIDSLTKGGEGGGGHAMTMFLLVGPYRLLILKAYFI